MLHGYGPSLLQGAALTLAVAFVSLGVALLLGAAGATARLSRHRLPRWIAQGYTTAIRGVPDLVMMLIVFYGGQVLVNHLADARGWPAIDVDPFVAGTLTIGFIFGAYFTEIFRGAVLAVPNGQREAALAYGMTRWQVLRRVVGPQMLRHALAPLSNCWLVMLKSTALVSVIGLQDLLQRAHAAGGSTGEPFVFGLAAAGLYLVFTAVSEWGFSRIGRRLDVGTKPNAY